MQIKPSTKIDLDAETAMTIEPSTKTDLAAEAAMAIEPSTKPIDTSPIVSGAAILTYADATWVGSLTLEPQIRPWQMTG